MLRRIVLGCLLVLVLPSSTAWAVPEDERAGAEALVQAFPLDPTGERIDAAARSDRRGRSEAVRALPESVEPASGSNSTSLVLATGIAASLLLVVGGLAAVQRRNGPMRRRGSVPLSQTGWPSTRQRILDYGAAELEPAAIAGPRQYPDIPGRGRVSTLELPAGEAPSAAPPPPVEWRSVA